MEGRLNVIIVLLTIALFLAIGLGIWAIVVLVAKNFKLNDELSESAETIAILRAALQRPAIAGMTAEQVKNLADLLRAENGIKPWQN